MKVLILTHGTRGDVQPYAALAHALHEAGHDAILAGPAASASLAEPYGFKFAPVDDGPNKLIDDPHIRQAIETNYRGLRGKRVALDVMRASKPLMAAVLRDMADVAAGGADLVVHAAGIPGQHFAEALGVPSVPVALQPVWVPTAAFRNPMLPIPWPRAFNRASFAAVRLLLRSFAGIADEIRTDRLGLPKRQGRHDILHQADGAPSTVLQGFSRHVLPGALDYPPTVHTTGFWYLPASADWTPSPELAAFLDSGEPPVYIGFGSMAGTDPERVGRIITEAVRIAGVRAILATGWGGISTNDLPEEVLLLDQAPHDRLFPRMSAIVHHGGSGTTGAALLSGKPQVVCPFVADQPFWATRMHTAGVAPSPLPQRHLTPEALATAVGATRADGPMRGNARKLADRIRADNGVGTAVTILETLA